MKLTNQELVYQYVLTQILLAYDHTNRGKKGVMTKIEKLGKELVKRDLLTQAQADELLNY